MYSSSAEGVTAQSSRFAFRVDEDVARIHAYGYLDADFNDYLRGNAYVSTNSNTLRMRVYYLNLAHGKWEILGIMQIKTGFMNVASTFASLKQNASMRS